MANQKIAVVCAWCKRVKDEEGKWQKVPMPEEIRITHGICPECEKKAEEELER